MAETYLDGLIDVENLPADSRPGDWGERLLRNHPNEALLQAITQRLKRKRTVDPEFHVYELGRWPFKAYLNMGGDAAAGDTVLTVDDGAGVGTSRYFQKGTLVRVGADPSAGEILRVTVDPTNNTQITVARSWGATAAGAIANNTQLTIIGHADAETSDSPNGRVRVPDDVTNYVQIFQTPYRLSRLARATATRFGEPVKTMSHKDALIQHAQERELAMLYGEAVKENDATEGVRYSTGGITSFITTHLHDGSGANFTSANAYAWIEAMAGEGSDERIAFIGKTAYASIMAMIRHDGMQIIEPAENRWGMRLKRLTSAGPDLLIHNHRLLDEVAPGDIIIVDLAYLTARFMSGDEGNFDFRHEAVELDNNNQVSKWQFYSIVGLQLGYEKAHGYIKGITTWTHV